MEMTQEQIIVSVLSLKDDTLRALYDLIAAELNRRDKFAVPLNNSNLERE